MCIGVGSSHRLPADFRELFWSVRLAASEQQSFQLIEHQASRLIRVQCSTQASDFYSSIQVITKRVNFLLDHPTASYVQIKAALKLVVLVKQMMKSLLDATNSQYEVQRNELVVREMLLLQKLADVDPKERTPVTLACHVGCLDYVINRLSENVACFSEIEVCFKESVLSRLFLDGDRTILRQLLVHPASQQRTCEYFFSQSPQQDASIIAFMEDLYGMANRDRVLGAYALCVAGCSRAVGKRIGELLHEGREELNPMLMVDGTELRAIVAVPSAMGENGFFSTFLKCTASESSSKEMQKKFVEMRWLKDHFPGITRASFPECFNVMEAALWLSIPREELSKLYTCRSFEDELGKLKKTVFKKPLESYMMSVWNIDRHHLHEVCFESPKKYPEGIRLERLLEKYQELFPTETSKAQDLVCFVNRIVSKVPFFGTPNEGSPQLVEYYDTIAIHIAHTIALLEAKNDPRAWKNCLQEYVACIGPCGGRSFVVALAEYFKASNQGNTPREIILRSLAQLRQVWFEQTILRFEQTIVHNMDDRHTPNLLNKALHFYGLHYGVPGGQAAQTFVDRFGDIISSEEIEASFVENYTVQAMVQWLLDSAKETEMKQALMDYYTIRMPIGWKQELYDPVLKEVDALILQEMPDEKKQVELKRLLEKVDAEMQTGETPQHAILAAQKYDFLEKYFFDEKNEIRPEAILHILTDMKVLSTPLGGADFLWVKKGVEEPVGFLSTIQKIWALFWSLFH